MIPSFRSRSFPKAGALKILTVCMTRPRSPDPSVSSVLLPKTCPEVPILKNSLGLRPQPCPEGQNLGVFENCWSLTCPDTEIVKKFYVLKHIWVSLWACVARSQTDASKKNVTCVGHQSPSPMSLTIDEVRIFQAILRLTFPGVGNNS